MKKTIILLLCIFFLFGCSSPNEVIGIWIDTETENIVEFTKDGYYNIGLNNDPWQERTRYEVDGDEIIIYYDSDRRGTEFSMEYEISDEGHLIINDTIEYRPLDLKTEKQ